MESVLNHLPPVEIGLFCDSFCLIKQIINDGKKFSSGSVGKESVIADIPEIGVRDMGNEPGDELHDG